MPADGVVYGVLSPKISTPVRKIPVPKVATPVRKKFDLLAALGVDVLTRCDSKADLDMGRMNMENMLRQIVQFKAHLGEEVTYDTMNILSTSTNCSNYLHERVIALVPTSVQCSNSYLRWATRNYL